jgi:hypothetical protein
MQSWKPAFIVIVVYIFAVTAYASDKGLNSWVVDQEGRFMSYSNDVVVDQEKELMWTASDNGTMIDYPGAVEYCENLDLGGYTDWRMPDLSELETIFTPDSVNPTPPTKGCDGGYRANRLFKITCCCVWASEDQGTRAASYPFAVDKFWHHRSGQSGNRALCVREVKP